MTTANRSDQPENETRDHGPQPLIAILESCGLSGQDLVAASGEQLTHKQVQKAKKGRKVSPNIQGKILRALQKASNESRWQLSDLFTY